MLSSFIESERPLKFVPPKKWEENVFHSLHKSEKNGAFLLDFSIHGWSHLRNGFATVRLMSSISPRNGTKEILLKKRGAIKIAYDPTLKRIIQQPPCKDSYQDTPWRCIAPCKRISNICADSWEEFMVLSRSQTLPGPLVHSSPFHEWARQNIRDTTREKNITTFKTEFH